MSRAQREDIEQVFGKVNVRKWADLDNKGVDADITARIERALDLADEFISNRLGFRYPNIPQPYPVELIDASARYAGWLLYEARDIEDAEAGEGGVSRMSNHRKKVLRWLAAVRSGVVPIGTGVEAVGVTMVPTVIRDEVL